MNDSSKEKLLVNVLRVFGAGFSITGTLILFFPIFLNDRLQDFGENLGLNVELGLSFEASAYPLMVMYMFTLAYISFRAIETSRRLYVDILLVNKFLSFFAFTLSFILGEFDNHFYLSISLLDILMFTTLYFVSRNAQSPKESIK